MEFIMDALHNQILLSAVLSWAIAQGTKIIINMIRNGFSLHSLIAGGDMPSAHGATVTGLTVGTAITCGGGSAEFAIALFLAIIVVYDAAGVRYETGVEARILNRLRARDINRGEKPLYDKDLDEHMGHTVPELIAGICLGAVVSVIVCRIL